jgi:hypothetical protein
MDRREACRVKMYWPFEALLDRNGRACDWAALHGPIVTTSHHDELARLRRVGVRFVGVTSHFDFPRTDPVDGLDYEAVCEAWCHCFRDPERRFMHASPRALISASDFTDGAWVECAAGSAEPLEPHGILYVGAREPWQQGAKNWPLAARCLPVLCRALGTRALVIGQADATFATQSCVTFCDTLPWPVLLATLAQAQLLFVPNAEDPSPRVVAEALCLDVPVLVQRNISGGWKYVNCYTGAFFDDEHDVVEVATGLLGGAIAPRAWFRANFGPEPSARRLTALLRQLDGSVDEAAGWRISAAGPHRAASNWPRGE